MLGSPVEISKRFSNHPRSGICYYIPVRRRLGKRKIVGNVGCSTCKIYAALAARRACASACRGDEVSGEDAWIWTWILLLSCKKLRKTPIPVATSPFDKPGIFEHLKEASENILASEIRRSDLMVQPCCSTKLFSLLIWAWVVELGLWGGASWTVLHSRMASATRCTWWGKVHFLAKRQSFLDFQMHYKKLKMFGIDA